MNETIITAVKRQITPLEEMNVIDDFLFNEMLFDEDTGEEVCRIILERVLKRSIGKIHFTAQKMVPGMSENGQGIRMDAYITEMSDADTEHPDIDLYDIEPDKKEYKKKTLPKRCRYYSDLIDVQIVNSGVDYEKLPKIVIIFILSYDPFGHGDMYYEAGSILKTHPNHPYDDGVRRIYLYTEGRLPKNADDNDKKLKNLLKYIRRSTKDNVIDDTTRRLDEIVTDTKRKKDIGVKYMKSWELERELKEEGREEGRKEGREEGREEERANTEAERRRADAAEAQVDRMKAELAKYKEKFGII